MATNVNNKRSMEREELIKLIMERIYTRRIYAEKLADDILRLFNVVGQSEQLSPNNKLKIVGDFDNNHNDSFRNVD